MATTHPVPRRRLRLVPILATTTIGVYVLIVVGVTESLTGGAVVCPAWPGCGGTVLPPADLQSTVVLGHRLLAVAAGCLLVTAAITAWRRRARRRVQVTLGLAVGLYALAIWTGALTAVDGSSTPLATAHLVSATAVFSGLLAALCWQLEAETPTPPADDAGTTVVPEADDAPAGPPAGASRPSFTRRVWAYVRLTKPKLWWLLCLVAVASMTLAGSGVPPLGTALATLAGGVLAIGASGTFNNAIEADRDRQMSRTADRPLVEGTISTRNAVAFGLALTVASVAVFLAFVNALAAGLGLLAVLFYSVGYTVVLKPRTTQNVVVGGAVGAFPALIGWAAVTDAVGVPAVVLGAVIFLWTPAHFYNLALAYRADYARAGLPMLPVVRGAAVTRRHIVGYLGATMLGTAALGAVAGLDWTYVVVVVAGGAGFLAAVIRLYRVRTDRAAFRAFMASNAYLGALLVAIVLDTVFV